MPGSVNSGAGCPTSAVIVRAPRGWWSAHRRLEDIRGDVEVGVHVLHVVVLLERVDHPQDLLRARRVLERNALLRQHRRVGTVEGHTRALERGAYGLEIVGTADHLP